MSRKLGGADFFGLGDIAAARFETAATWTCLIFFRVGTHDAVDESSFIAKWDGADQFILQVDNGSAPQDVQVRTNGTTRISGTGSIINPGKWWLCAVTNDGAGGAAGLKLYVADMDGAFDAGYNPATGQHATDAALTAPVEIGARGSDAKDYFNGDLAHAAYFASEFSSAKVLQYLRHPPRVAMTEGANCIFYLPLGFAGGTPERDLSGNLNNGTITGTPTISEMPPPASLMMPPVAIMPPVAAAPAGAIMNQLQGPNVGADLFNGTLL